MKTIIHIPVSEENKVQRIRRILPGFLYAAYALLVILSVDNGFFWDSILQGSEYGQWFYSTNFSHFFYPENLDAGYSPLFGMALAFAWKVFGYKLSVSHFLILPFALGIVYQTLTLTRKYLPIDSAIYIAILILADPTLLAQITQISPDVILVFLYLFCLNKLLSNNRRCMAVALVFLGLLSLRGSLAVVCIFVTDALFTIFIKQKFSLRKFIISIGAYLPAFVIVSSWLIGHFLHTGWIGYNPDPNWNWSGGRQLLPLTGMLRNIIIICWRMLDFGRLFISLGLIVSGGYFIRKGFKFPPETMRLFVLVSVPFLVFSIISIPYSNPIGHRYYLVVFLLQALFTGYLWAHIPNRFFRRFTYGFMLIGLLTGHFWIYPDSVAKGWDATLAHVPYFSLRKKAISYLDEKNIPLAKVGSDFPNLAPPSITDLNEDTRHFKPKDLETDAYILYSNIFNGFSDEELAALKNNWQVVKSWKKGQVKMILYKKSD